MISFDIFDTLITRTTIESNGIFTIMQQKMNRDDTYKDISKYIRENFYTLRIHAEELARYNNVSKGIEEITLREIYDALAMAGGLLEEQTEKLLHLECDIELENILPINKNIALLKEKLIMKERVILISDMYLPLNVLRSMLENVDDIFHEITIYVSSELRARKTSGNIYKCIKEKENIEYSQWTHYGNDMQQDIINAELLGIKAVHLQGLEMTCYEKIFCEQLSENVSFQIIAGQAKYTRVEGDHNISYEIGASICGPILYAYASWIIKQSVDKGIRRLYFIARDGFLVKVVADKIILNKQLDIETKYIYGSRKAWRMCSLTLDDFNLVQVLRWSYVYKIHRVGDLAELLEIDVKELIPFLPYGCKKEQVELSSQALYQIVEVLEQNQNFKKIFVVKQAEKRKLVKKYICQEVDMTDDSFAFVDVSGGGLTQGCLSKILSDFYEKPIKTFFFKLDRVNLVKNCIFYVYFPSALKNNLVIEMICRAPHGQTLGYCIHNGKVVPIFDYFENKALLEHGFEQLQIGLKAYIDNILKRENRIEFVSDSLSIVKKYLTYVAETPDKKVLEYFSTYPNNESGRECEITEFAPKLDKEDVLNIFVRRMPGEHISNYYKGTDIAYSIMRCNEEERILIDKCKQEYNAGWARHERAEKIQRENIEIKKYGRAVNYPCELLEKDIVLYGAGKLGKDLYNKIKNLGISRIVEWVDKNAVDTSYPENVKTPDVIMNVEYDQLVIAVMSQEIAEQIKKELIELGVPEEKIFWIQVYKNKYEKIKWE